MANVIYKKQFSIIFSTFLFLIIAGLLNNVYKKPILVISKQDSAVNFNSNLVKAFSMGQKRLIATTLWITTLLESDIDHYKSNDLNSWMYLRFKTLFELDSKFLFGYRFAGRYLSIVKDDLQGAKEIFEQGLSYYPNDYTLNLDAGFLYAFELQDYQRAKVSYRKILQFKRAPDFIRSIIHKLDYEVTQDKELTRSLLLETYKTLPNDSFLKDKIKKDLYSLQAEIDLECLNSILKNCRKLDFFGDKYIQSNGAFKSKTPFTKYRLNKINNQ